jgi:hypothetical protein
MLMKTSRLWRGLALCVLVLVASLTVYRAKTQTIAHDEALEYEWFLDGGVYRVLQFNVTNHILFTLIAKPIVWTLGTSEFLLRLPSLLGSTIYLLAAYLLSRRLFGEGILLFLSVAMLCLNPQILDFMPAARGYILGLAALIVAIYAMTVLVGRGELNPGDRAWKWGCAVASVALAMSVAANLSNFVAALCLALTFSWVAVGGFPADFEWRDRKLRFLAKYLLVPGAATGFCILWPYLIQMRRSQFEMGSGVKNPFVSLKDAFTASLLYKWTDDVDSSILGAFAPSTGGWQDRVTLLGVYVLMPLLFCLVAAGVILASRATTGSRSKESGQCQLVGGAALATVVLIVVLHVTAGVHYPKSRLCLFLIPLFTLGGLLAGGQISARFSGSYLRIAGLMIAVIVVIDYALSLQVTHFRYNAYDVISLKLYQTIAEDAQRRGLTSVRAGGTWWYEPEINFYRRKFKATWMMEYDVKDKSYWWQTPNTLTPSDYDYFVFTPAGDPGLSGPNVRTVFRDSKREITVVANEK